MSHENNLKCKQDNFGKTILPEMMEEYCNLINLEFPSPDKNELVAVSNSQLPANELVKLIHNRCIYQLDKLNPDDSTSPRAHLEAILDNACNFSERLKISGLFAFITEIQHLLEIMFHLGYNVAANDLHVLAIEPAIKGEKATVRCNNNGENMSERQEPVNQLIKKMYFSFSENPATQSFKKQDAYEAIHNTIMDFLSLKELPQEIEKLFLPYGGFKTVKSPSIAKIRKVAISLDIKAPKKMAKLTSRSKLENHLKKIFLKKNIIRILS